MSGIEFQERSFYSALLKYSCTSIYVFLYTTTSPSTKPIMAERHIMALGPEAPAFKPEPQGAGGIQMLRNRLKSKSDVATRANQPTTCITISLYIWMIPMSRICIIVLILFCSIFSGFEISESQDIISVSQLLNSTIASIKFLNENLNVFLDRGKHSQNVSTLELNLLIKVQASNCTIGYFNFQ